MKILIINAILYTSETAQIKKVDSIKDTMIYDLCLAFKGLGAEPVLYAAEPYKPVKEESYPFEIIFAPCAAKRLFMPHRIPYMPDLKKYIKQHGDEFDLIISSEVFSVLSFITARMAPEKTVIWHELAKHNSMMKQLPSKLWYGIIARLFLSKTRVAPRSEEARAFISKYCTGTLDTVIDHGVNLDKFSFTADKSNQFSVCSQLIERKRIDLIIDKFKAYLDKYDPAAILYIMGNGELKDDLTEQANQLGIGKNVIFTGKLQHSDMMPVLAKSKALLINTTQDNSMISIVESLAVGTPIITTTVPLNCSYIVSNKLGIADDNWNEDDMFEIAENNRFYVNNCREYRKQLSTERCATQFLDMI